MNVCGSSVSDSSNEGEDLFSIVISEVGEGVWYLDSIVKENDGDPVFRSHDCDDGPDCMLHEVEQGVTKIFVLGVPICLACCRLAHGV